MRYIIEIQGESVPVEVQPLGGDRYTVRLGDGPIREVNAHLGQLGVHLRDGLGTTRVHRAHRDETTFAHAAGHTLPLRVQSPAAARRREQSRAAALAGGSRIILSPMPGRVVKVLVTPGQAVLPGQGVVIVEAMKMENELRAEVAGTVQTVKCAPCDLVEGGAELVILAP